MDLYEFYPKPQELIKSELNVLDYIRSQTYIKDRQPEFARAAAQYYGRGIENDFEFNSFLEFWHPGMHRKGHSSRQEREAQANVRITISALILRTKKTFQNVTYCLSVCRIRAARDRELPHLTILRKFHFDVAIEGSTGGTRVRRHPQCHLQYCGEMLPFMTKLGCREAQLQVMHPWLSEPRIFYSPMSLALLIDMALQEFQDQHSVKFRNETVWRGLVRGQEKLILQPFYEKCLEVIAGKDTLADAFYVG